MKVKKISGMTEFANLFLSVYALKKQSKDNKIYLSRYFKSVISSIFENLPIDDKIYEYNLIHDGYDSINIKEFISAIKVSAIKKYWGDPFTYDLERDCLVIEIEQNRAQKELNNYDEDSVNFVEDIVKSYIRTSGDFDKLGDNVVKLKYYL